MASEVKVLARLETELCKMSGISKSGNQYTMIVFRYHDPNLGKDVFLKPSMQSDQNMIELMYLKGWTPPKQS